MSEFKIIADKVAVASERPITSRDDGIALANVHLAEFPKTKEIVVEGDDGSLWRRTQTTPWKREKEGETSVWPKVAAGAGVLTAVFAVYQLFFKKPETLPENDAEPPFIQHGTKVLGVFDNEAARDAFATAAHAAGAAFLGITVPVMDKGVDLDSAAPYVGTFSPDIVLLGLTRQAANGATFFQSAINQGKVINIYTNGTPPPSENQNLTNLRNASKPFYGVAPKADFANLAGFARETLAILGRNNPSQNERIL